MSMQEVSGRTCYVCLCFTDICDLFASAFFGRSENNCYLYGVFNGYDGNRVTNFVGQRLSAELLLGQLHADHSDADVRRVLLQVMKFWPGTAPDSHTTYLLFYHQRSSIWFLWGLETSANGCNRSHPEQL